MNVFLELFKPFATHEVEWRVGSKKKDNSQGLALAYVNSRAIMDRLDLVVGPMNWTDSYTEINKGVICTLALKIGGEWIAKSDGADNTDVEAIKGGISSAIKRAAVKFGIGRYLYGFPSPWVALKPAGNSFILTDEGKQVAAKKLDEFVKGYYRLTPVLTKPQAEKLTSSYENRPVDFPTLKAIFGTDEVNVLAAQNVMLLMSGWSTMNELQKETEVFKVAYATWSGLPYVYSRFV